MTGSPPPRSTTTLTGTSTGTRAVRSEVRKGAQLGHARDIIKAATAGREAGERGEEPTVFPNPYAWTLRTAWIRGYAERGAPCPLSRSRPTKACSKPRRSCSRKGGLPVKGGTAAGFRVRALRSTRPREVPTRSFPASRPREGARGPVRHPLKPFGSKQAEGCPKEIAQVFDICTVRKPLIRAISKIRRVSLAGDHLFRHHSWGAAHGPP
ncbi:Rmf/CrpP fold protein [Streptomyces sp. NPDC048248]|uniref:Rmf/CrpP fold protein n=1 Tax=Streptomyces sp. NPDC048248 TaxID=3365523 RepID=UPI003719804F